MEEDYKKIFNTKGYSIGFTGTCELRLIQKEILNKFNNQIQNAKYIYVLLSLNTKQTLFSIDEVLNKISSILNDNIEVAFHTDTSSDILINKCNYTIVVAGLDEL
ncbi:MAG: hypothetical protein DRG78_00890 [Epsilonproteobacteria bacterium]|nr:MAG: hypothetical protein DRG78_00890 [Campylobacterota bacterium]